MKRPTTDQIENMVGIKDIAAGLHVERTTVNSWIARDQLPAPLMRVDGKPLYWWPEIKEWHRAR